MFTAFERGLIITLAILAAIAITAIAISCLRETWLAREPRPTGPQRAATKLWIAGGYR